METSGLYKQNFGAYGPFKFFTNFARFLSGLSLGYGLDDLGFESRQGLGISLFATVSRPALGPTQPPIQCVQWLFPWGKVAGA
jgi:hypothetical protein